MTMNSLELANELKKAIAFGDKGYFRAVLWEMKNRKLITDAEFFKKLSEAGISYGFEPDVEADYPEDTWDYEDIFEELMADYFGTHVVPDQGVTEDEI